MSRSRIPSSPPSAPTVRSRGAGSATRGIVLQGAAAHSWFAQNGFAVEAGQFHVVADVLSAPDFHLARVWHPPGRMRAVERRGVPLVLVQLEGTSRVDVDAGSGSLTPGTMVFIAPGSSLALESETPVARLEIATASVALTPGTREEVERGAVLDWSARASGGVLVASAITALNGELDPGDAGFSAFRLAVANLLASTLTDATDGDDRSRVPRRRDLYRSAMEIIAREASDPAFSVARLAQALNVSQQYVRMIFSAHGTTARAEIRSCRAALARTHLAVSGEHAALTTAEAARLSGFRDVATMRAALRATGAPTDPATAS